MPTLQKRIFISYLVLLLITFLLSMTALSHAHADTVYENQERGISFTLPEGWAEFSNPAIAKAMQNVHSDDKATEAQAKDVLQKWKDKPEQQVSFIKRLKKDGPNQAVAIEVLFRSPGQYGSASAKDILSDLDTAYLKIGKDSHYLTAPVAQDVNGCAAAHSVLEFSMMISGQGKKTLQRDQWLIRRGKDHLIKISLMALPALMPQAQPEFAQIVQSMKIAECK